MFADKIKKMEKQQDVYLKTVTGYHDLIEALLFREQKKYFGSIDYITNRFDAIYINILKSKDIEKISLPFFDSDMSIWKSKLYSINDIKNRSKQLIDKYTIYIDKVENLESSRYEQIAELNEKLSELREEHEELLNHNQKNKELLDPRKQNEELDKLKNEISRLKQKNEELDKLKNEISILKQKNEELAKSKDKELSRLKQEIDEKCLSLREQENKLSILEHDNLNLRQVNDDLAKQCFPRYIIDNLIVKDDNIILETPFIIDLPDQNDIKFTLSELIRSKYVIKNEKIELVVNSMTIENVNVKFERESNKFIYQYNYLKKYKDQEAIFPADGKTKIVLTDNVEHLAYTMNNYTVWFYATLK